MRNTRPITGGIAHLLQRIVLDDEKFDLPTLPPVVGGVWGDVDLEGLWGPLSFDGPELVWEVQAVHNAPTEIDAKLLRLDALRNEPAILRLADGRSVRAKFGHTRRWGTRRGMPAGYTCEFTVWHVDGRPPKRWVGKLRGGGCLSANLTIAGPGPGRRFSSSHMRLEGSHTWYLLDMRQGGESVDVVIDGGPSPLDQGALGQDFSALQVAFGAPMQLDTLVAFDEPGNVVGCAGVHLGGNRRTELRRRADGPVPDGVEDECWIPIFFRQLARAMVADGIPWNVACAAYLDSVSDATIDSRYLKLHIALEALAKALLKRDEVKQPAPRRLVRDVDVWIRWVKEHSDVLRAMVNDDSRPQVFLDKIISAMNLPSSSVVADALSRLEPPLIVDEAVLDEIDQRNIPAHHLSMNKPGVGYDVDRDVERVDILRSLFVALMARACGYDGAIAGWVTNSAAGWKPQPNWWPAASASTMTEARVSFLCERGTGGGPR